MKRVNFIIKLTIFLFICVTIVISGLYTYAYFSDEITLNSANRVQIYDYKNDIVYQGSGDRNG